MEPGAKLKKAVFCESIPLGFANSQHDLWWVACLLGSRQFSARFWLRSELRTATFHVVENPVVDPVDRVRSAGDSMPLHIKALSD
jgi:hypothetical protein